MAAHYKTPGVYIEETSAFPPSVAEISSAIPVFVGYTKTATFNGKDLTGTPTPVSSLLDYVTRFGGRPAIQFASIEVSDPRPSNHGVRLLEVEDAVSYLTGYLYHCLETYFLNGGGSCYILSIGGYASAAPFTHLHDYLGVAERPALFDPDGPLARESSPTLIVMPDLPLFPTRADGTSDQFTVQQAALAFCALPDQGHRFALLDLNERPALDENQGITPFVYDDPAKNYFEDFRVGIGQNHL
jgi:uncharacterized protein